jgi:hypothetical protein
MHESIYLRPTEEHSACTVTARAATPLQMAATAAAKLLLDAASAARASAAWAAAHSWHKPICLQPNSCTSLSILSQTPISKKKENETFSQAFFIPWEEWRVWLENLRLGLRCNDVDAQPDTYDRGCCFSADP